MANFTAITTGAAANAATVNGPLAQLDTAIGALSGLPTSDKSSIVASLVELQASTNGQIGVLGSLTTTDQTTLVAAINEVRNNLLVGGIYVTPVQLKDWTESEAYEATSVTMDTTFDRVVSTAVLKWPDGSAGVFTATSINATWECVDAYTVTHASSGYTVTQAAVTRDSNGRVVTKPALVVS